MTRTHAIETIRDLLDGRLHDPYWTDEMKEGYRHACREITEALDAAGAFDPPDVPCTTTAETDTRSTA